MIGGVSSQLANALASPNRNKLVQLSRSISYLVVSGAWEVAIPPQKPGQRVGRLQASRAVLAQDPLGQDVHCLNAASASVRIG